MYVYVKNKNKRERKSQTTYGSSCWVACVQVISRPTELTAYLRVIGDTKCLLFKPL